MELLVLISLAVSFLLGSAAANQNQCGCIDQSWCNKKDPQKKLDCPFSHSLCSNDPLTEGEPSRLDSGAANVSTKCSEGWSVASLKDAVYGFPNRLVPIVQNNLTDGNEHTMYTDGYNGKKPARFIFKSNDKTGNVPLFMTMFFWKEYISMNEKKDGRWCPNDIRVKNRVNSGEWHMQFKVRMSERKQKSTSNSLTGNMTQFTDFIHRLVLKEEIGSFFSRSTIIFWEFPGQGRRMFSSRRAQFQALGL
ncbi:hypothetical protein AB6A40_011087 [Gnathostoma spinigerum]|uniref:Uncharacterized protein n=1 Tax=Gnathostoma spinigerum TaxID=75299 RepID=A0ABD6EX73_9BILA